MEEKKWSKEKEELFNRWTKYHTKENRGIVGFQQSMEDVLDFILEEVDKAREEGRREGSEITSRYISDFVKSESGKSGRKEILEYIEELSKLRQ